MDNTNVEEESSDAAAYGLVALCDQNYSNLSSQSSEEVVETSNEISHHVVDESTVKIIIESIAAANNQTGSNLTINTTIINDDEDEKSQKIQSNISNSNTIDCQNLELHPSITCVQEECTTNKVHLQEGICSMLQATAELVQQKSEKKDASNVVVLSGMENLNVEQIKQQFQQQSSKSIGQQGIVIEELTSEIENTDDSKVLVSYQVDVLDEHYLQALKSRQALMREAIEWKVYVRMLLDKGCSLGANFHEPEVLSVLKTTDDVVMKAEILSRITEKDMLQPAVQFWDFEKVYEFYGNNRALNCPSCSLPLSFVPFVQRFALRMLYDVDRPVLLVTSFLRCLNKGKKQHEILGYDPRLLRMFSDLDLPFMLFHKAGITKKMMEFILESIIGGMTVNRLFDVVKTKYEVNHTIISQFFANEIETIRAHIMAEGGQIEISLDAMFPPYVNCHPSKALLGRCFLAAFKEKDEYYKFCMQKLLANECIVLDDSLSVGARIGMPGVWGNAVKMFPEEYQGIFLVFNEAKHILSWTFLKENNFSDVEELLTELRNRHVLANAYLKACFTTRCCDWRDDLRKIFGKWFIVKGNLRLFLDQIVKEMPPDHMYYKDCVEELTLTFREVNDSEDVRKEFTADPSIISNNLQEFLKRWRDVIDDRIQAVLTQKAIQLIEELDQHVKAGCLSGIPPEVGDENFNEIHNTLRKSVSHCRITVPLVSALFSMCLHEVNRSKGAPTDFQYTPEQDNDIQKSDGVKAIEGTSVSSQTDQSLPQHAQQTSSMSIQPGLLEQPPIISSSKIDKQEQIPASSVILLVHEYYKQKEVEISTLLLQALMYYKYQEDFDAFAPQAIQNLRLLPYFSSALNLISHPAFPKEAKTFDTKLISQGLLKMELKIRRLHVGIGNSVRLTGSLSDIFPIVCMQLKKDRMSDNLSVDVLEYLKELLSKGVHLIDMKDQDLIASLKHLVNFQTVQVESIKRELLGTVNKSLNPVPINNDNSENAKSMAPSVDSISSKPALTLADNTRNSPTTVTTSQTIPSFNVKPNLATDTKGTSTDSGTDLTKSAALGTQITTTITTSLKETAEKMGEVDNVDRLTHLATVAGNDNIMEVSCDASLNFSAEECDNNEIIGSSSTKRKASSEGKMTNDQMEVEATSPSVSNNLLNAQQSLTSTSTSSSTETQGDSATVSYGDFELLKNLADRLGAVITLFTELDHCWVIPVFPEKFSLFSPHFFVIHRFQRFFPAWLNNKASVSSIRNINMKRQGKEPQCRCGRGTPGKTGQGRCVSRENGKYLTRCICFRLDRGCGNLCDCRGCENPFGMRPQRIRVKKAKVPYRQRYAHEAAKIATCKSSSQTTTSTQTPNIEKELQENKINEKNTEISMGRWVPLEHCLFESLINEIKSDDSLITPTEVQEIFNTVVKELTDIPGLEKAVFQKTTEQISMKLQQREKDVSDYLRIYQMQVDLSLG